MSTPEHVQFIPTVQQKLLRDKPATTVDEILDQIGVWNKFTIFVTISMALLWVLSCATSLAPSFMAPSNQCNNCSFVTVQQEFHIQRYFIDPGELTASSYYFGNFVFGQILATLADRIGRRPVLIFSLFLSGIVGTAAAFVPEFNYLLLARFIQGSTLTSLSMTNWIMCCESISFNGHGYASVLFGVLWVFGYCIVSPISYYLPTWRQLQLFTSLPSLLFGIFLYFTLPESLAFTVQSGRTEKVRQWIENATKFSGSDVDYDLSTLMEKREKNEQSFLATIREILKNREIVRNTAIELVVWVVDLMIYAALSLCSTSMFGNQNAHFSYLISGLVELPSYFILPAALDWLGRKPTTMASHVIAAFALAAMFLFDREKDFQIFIIVWLIAKFSIACAFMCCFVFGAELFPTHCRNICLGLCATVSNLGAMAGPHTFALENYQQGATFVFFAILAAVTTFLVAFLPETKPCDESSEDAMRISHISI